MSSEKEGLPLDQPQHSIPQNVAPPPYAAAMSAPPQQYGVQQNPQAQPPKQYGLQSNQPPPGFMPQQGHQGGYSPQTGYIQQQQQQPQQGYMPQPPSQFPQGAYPPQAQQQYAPAQTPGYIQQQPAMMQQAQHTNIIIGGQVSSADIRPQPPDYMTSAIIATLFFCWPLGIMAILKASEARSLYQSGNIQLAYDSSARARYLSNLAYGIGIVVYVVITISIIATNIS